MGSYLVDLPQNVDVMVDDAAQALVRTLATETGKQAVSWFANLWRRKKAKEVDDVAESVEQDREQLRGADAPVRDALSEALQRKWAAQLRRLLQDDPDGMADLMTLTQRLRQHGGGQIASNPIQYGVNSGSGDFIMGTFQTINRGQK